MIAPARVWRDDARLESPSWHVAQKTCVQSRSTAVAASRTSKQTGHSSQSESESAAVPSAMPSAEVPSAAVSLEAVSLAAVPLATRWRLRVDSRGASSSQSLFETQGSLRRFERGGIRWQQREVVRADIAALVGKLHAPPATLAS